MKDDSLSRLVRALDTAMAPSAADNGEILNHDIEQAALRLQCLSQRLGSVAAESPYLSFLRRTTQRAAQTPIAISA